MNLGSNDDAELLEYAIDIEAAPEVVWDLWTTAEGLCAWWGTTAAVDPRPGGTIRVTMPGGPVMSGQVIEVDIPRSFVFTFGWEEPPPAGELRPGSTRVEIALEPIETGTRLRLVHRGLPTAHRPDHDAGWRYFLIDQLVTRVETKG